MKNALLLTEKETFFLKENRQDPITGDEFCVGDEIIFCASCKSAFLKESWEYMDSKHCGQSFTLKKFPIVSKLRLNKPIVYQFKKAETMNRFSAYLIDNGIALFLGFLAYVLAKELRSILYFEGEFYGWVTGTFYMVFRDIIGLKGSLGKRIMGLYFIDTDTKNTATPMILLFRNLVYWFCLFLAISLIIVLEIMTRTSGVIGMLFGFGLLIANIIHLFTFISDQKNIFDKMLKIELVAKK